MVSATVAFESEQTATARTMSKAHARSGLGVRGDREADSSPRRMRGRQFVLRLGKRHTPRSRLTRSGAARCKSPRCNDHSRRAARILKRLLLTTRSVRHCRSGARLRLAIRSPGQKKGPPVKETPNVGDVARRTSSPWGRSADGSMAASNMPSAARTSAWDLHALSVNLLPEARQFFHALPETKSPMRSNQRGNAWASAACSRHISNAVCANFLTSSSTASRAACSKNRAPAA